jgi:hypothetical protein
MTKNIIIEIGAKISPGEGLEYNDFVYNLIKGFTSRSIAEYRAYHTDFQKRGSLL